MSSSKRWGKTKKVVKVIAVDLIKKAKIQMKTILEWHQRLLTLETWSRIHRFLIGLYLNMFPKSQVSGSWLRETSMAILAKRESQLKSKTAEEINLLPNTPLSNRGSRTKVKDNRIIWLEKELSILMILEILIAFLGMIRTLMRVNLKL